MSQSLPADAPQGSQVAFAPRLAASRRLIATAFVLVMAHLPLLVLHGQNLWARDHYQFFPLLLPAAVVMGYRNVQGLGSLTPGRRSVCLALFGLALAFLTMGILFYSPWLGAFATQVTLLAAAFSLGGRRLVGSLLPAWLLLFLAIPLPLWLDEQFIAELQRLTSIGASHVLEVAGVLHVLEGNVINLGSHCILVEEACSGIHSLNSVLVCTLFWTAWMRRSVGHALLLLLAAFTWVLAGNVTRIVTVAMLDGVVGVNLNSGWGHEALGVCLFATMLGLVWSTDRLLLLLTPLIQFLLGELWLQLTTAKVEPFPTQPLAIATGSEPTRLPPLAATTLSAWPILTCYGLMAIAQAGALGSHIAGFSLASVAPDDTVRALETLQALETLEENTMPQQFETWKRVSFEITENSIDHPLGRYSRTWRYMSGDQSALASIFYPYRGWKEVKDCYTRRGWTVQNRVIHNADPASETGPYVTARLYQPGKWKFGYLMFQNRDDSGQPLTPPAVGLSDALRTRLAMNQTWQSLTGVATPPGSRPIYLVQLLLECSNQLDPIEEQKAEELYQQVLRVLPK